MLQTIQPRARQKHLVRIGSGVESVTPKGMPSNDGWEGQQHQKNLPAYPNGNLKAKRYRSASPMPSRRLSQKAIAGNRLPVCRGKLESLPCLKTTNKGIRDSIVRDSILSRRPS